MLHWSKNWNKSPQLQRTLPKAMLGLATLLFLGYLGASLYGSLMIQYAQDTQDLAHLWRALAGITIVVGMVLLGAWLNFRGPFRWWFSIISKRYWYYCWLLVLAWLLFELLQYRTEQDPIFVDENWLVAFALVGVVVVFSYVADNLRMRRERLWLEQQKTKAELAALQAQINPHFLFNALNTIYNEADAAQNDRVADLVQQLSGILRFTLQEAQKDYTTVAHELSFLEKYLALQRARLPQHDGLRVEIQLDYDDQPARIAPLLLIPFVENAFQYGISLQQPSFVKIKLACEESVLELVVQNSIAPQSATKSGHGTGIANVKKRLELLYPGRHELEIRPQEKVFEVSMKINL